jgi:predicted metal-binding membrane protein
MTESNSRSRYARDRLLIVFGIAAVSLAAWGYTLVDAYAMRRGDMESMWMPPTGGGTWSAADFLSVFWMWAVMMVAMMTPTATPVAMVFAAVNRQRQSRAQVFVPTTFFIAGYLIAWILFSALLTVLQWPMHVYSFLSPMMDNDSRLLAGGVLLAAGVYQWTPWKNACLDNCRTPLGFLMTQWREGRAGAVSMGYRHGWYCVGCCWALMLVMFAVGVMNIVWAALIALFVLVEKIAPVSPGVLRALSGLGFVLWGGWLIAAG